MERRPEAEHEPGGADGRRAECERPPVQRELVHPRHSGKRVRKESPEPHRRHDLRSGSPMACRIASSRARRCKSASIRPAMLAMSTTENIVVVTLMPAASVSATVSVNAGRRASERPAILKALLCSG